MRVELADHHFGGLTGRRAWPRSDAGRRGENTHSANSIRRLGSSVCVPHVRVRTVRRAVLAVGCTTTVAGTPVGPLRRVDEDSRSPVDADNVLLDKPRCGRSPVAATISPGTEHGRQVPGRRRHRAATASHPSAHGSSPRREMFGSEVEDFHKTTYQKPARGALISQGRGGVPGRRNGPTQVDSWSNGPTHADVDRRVRRRGWTTSPRALSQLAPAPVSAAATTG